MLEKAQFYWTEAFQCISTVTIYYQNTLKVYQRHDSENPRATIVLTENKWYVCHSIPTPKCFSHFDSKLYSAVDGNTK